MQVKLQTIPPVSFLLNPTSPGPVSMDHFFKNPPYLLLGSCHSRTAPKYSNFPFVIFHILSQFSYLNLLISNFSISNLYILIIIFSDFTPQPIPFFPFFDMLPKIWRCYLPLNTIEYHLIHILPDHIPTDVSIQKYSIHGVCTAGQCLAHLNPSY